MAELECLHSPHIPHQCAVNPHRMPMQQLLTWLQHTPGRMRSIGSGVEPQAASSTPGRSLPGEVFAFSVTQGQSASLLKAVLCGVHGTVFSRLLTWATAGNCVGGAGGTDCSGIKAKKYPSSKPAHTPSCSQMCFSTQTLPMDVSMPYQSMHVFARYTIPCRPGRGTPQAAT